MLKDREIKNFDGVLKKLKTALNSQVVESILNDSKIKSKNLLLNNIKNFSIDWKASKFKYIYNENPISKTKKNYCKNKLNNGLKTSKKEFYYPILATLYKSGGKENIKNVYKIIEKSMSSVFNKYDHGHLKSTPNVPRWKNTLRWARQDLVEMGFINNKTKIGVWSLTKVGKEWLDNYIYKK